MKINKALNLAITAHQGQYRKGTKIPYLVHILDVMKYLLYENVSEDLIIAGILHDTLEDTHISKETIQEFGQNVYDLVEFCTEPGNTVDAINLKETWHKRKEHSLNLLKTASKDQQLVYLADKLANIVSIQEELKISGVKVWERFNAPQQDILWYYNGVLKNLTLVNETRMYRLFKDVVEDVGGKQE